MIVALIVLRVVLPLGPWCDVQHTRGIHTYPTPITQEVGVACRRLPSEVFSPMASQGAAPDMYAWARYSILVSWGAHAESQY